MSSLRKSYLGLKPCIFKIFTPNLKDGVNAEFLGETIKYLPCPLGRGYTNNKDQRGFSPLSGWTQS